MKNENRRFWVGSKVENALRAGKPVVALESTIITHGMPWPTNYEMSESCSNIIIGNGAVPAVIGLLDGNIIVGMNDKEIRRLAEGKEPAFKASTKDLGYCISKKLNAGTTVAATMHCAQLAGITVFATGGIGGVHRRVGDTFDISADLHEFSRSRIIVVSAGCKSILDIPKTVEYLETLGVPVVGLGTDTFPAFFSRDSGVKLQLRAETPKEIAAIFVGGERVGLRNGLLLANPIPAENEIPESEIGPIIDKAEKDAESKGIVGKELTPYLLGRILELTRGRSLKANTSLVENNARVAAQTAMVLAEEAKGRKKKPGFLDE